MTETWGSRAALQFKTKQAGQDTTVHSAEGNVGQHWYIRSPVEQRTFRKGREEVDPRL